MDTAHVFTPCPVQEIGVAVVANLDAVNSVVDRIAEYALDLVLASNNGNPVCQPDPPTHWWIP